MAKQERQYLTAISIINGIISLIDMNGEIKCYRQRGIHRLNEKQLRYLINHGYLDANWEKYEELPGYITIAFEDPAIMGRAVAKYTIPAELRTNKN